MAVGNKICAKRLEQRRHEMHRARVRNVRSLVDTSEPTAIQMDHVRINLKREQQLEERYSEIDRENRILLNKMSNIMRQQGPPVDERPPGPQSLNRDFRKKELLRITKENQSILKRIQQAQPQYNHVEWEGHHRRNLGYLQNCAEYPLILKSPRPNPGSPSSELVPLKMEDAPVGTSMNSARSATGQQQQEVIDRPTEEDVRCVLKEGRQLGGTYYLIEMSTDGQTLSISAYDGYAQMTLDLVVKEKTHRRLYRETNGNYSLLVPRLRVDGDRLILDDGPPDSAREPQFVPSGSPAAALTDISAVSGSARPPTMPVSPPHAPGSASNNQQTSAPASPSKKGGSMSTGGTNFGADGTTDEELDADAIVIGKAKPGFASNKQQTSPPASPSKKGGSVSRDEELDADAIVIGKAKPGSASSADVEIDLNSTGGLQSVQVKLRNLTPSSGGRGSPSFPQ